MRIQICWKMDDGVPWAGSQAVKKWVATQVTETMSLDTPERFRRLRSLREFAEEAAEPELAATVRRFVGWARLDMLGQSGGERERQALAQIVEWATLQVEFDLV